MAHGHSAPSTSRSTRPRKGPGDPAAPVTCREGDLQAPAGLQAGPPAHPRGSPGRGEGVKQSRLGPAPCSTRWLCSPAVPSQASPRPPKPQAPFCQEADARGGRGLQPATCRVRSEPYPPEGSGRAGGRGCVCVLVSRPPPGDRVGAPCWCAWAAALGLHREPQRRPGVEP